MSRRALRSVSVLAALALWAGTPLPAQAPPKVVIPVEVARVVVDVRVVDAKGTPVHGLGAANFSVTLDGQPARVESATWRDARAGFEALRPVAGGDATNTNDAPVKVPGRLLVFLFHLDVGRSNLPGLLTMMKEAARMADSLGRDDRAAVLLVDSRLRLKLDFTGDRQRLRAMLSRGVLLDNVPPPAPGEGLSLAAHLTPEAARSVSRPEDALRVLAEALQPLPGPKSVIFLSGGFGRLALESPQWGAAGGGGTAALGTPPNVSQLLQDRAVGLNTQPLRLQRDLLDSDYGRAVVSLNAARAAVYALDIVPFAEEGIHAGSLKALADDTGGFYAKTFTFPAGARRTVERVLDGYYLLACERPDLPGGVHAIRVGLVGTKAFVMARRSYTD